MSESNGISSSAEGSGVDQERYLRLFEALSPLVAAQSVDDLAKAACSVVSELLEVQACSMFLAEPGGDDLVLKAATHIEPDSWSEIRISRDKGICGKAFFSGKPVLLTSEADFAEFDMEPRSELGQASCVVCPLFVRGEVRGIINIANPLNGRVFTARDVGLIEAASRVISGGILNAVQFGETVQIHAQLESLFDNLHIGVLALDRDLRVTHSNWRLRSLRGDPDSLVKGRLLSEVLDPSLYCLTRRLIRDSLKSRTVEQDRIDGRMGDKSRMLEITVSPAGLGGDASTECLIMFEDVSLDEEVKRLREADSLKDGFLRLISHELRTPLAVIRGTLPLMQTCCAKDNEKSEQMLNKIESLVKNNVSKLTGIVNSIIDTVEIENGSLKLLIKDADISEIVRSRIEFAKLDSEAKDLAWEINLDDSLGPVAGDETRLSQIVFELLSNAVKFSPRGATISVSTRRDCCDYVLRIANGGGGIAPERRDTVFDKFFQIDNSSTRAEGGCGLGLYLTQNIARLHGGSVAIVDGNSDETVFELRLPFAMAEEALG